MENDDIFSDIGLDNLLDSIDIDSPSSGDVVQDDQGLSNILDLQPIIDRLDNIEALLSVDPEPVSNDFVRTFNSLDQALLFLILIVATCIFLFRGKK